MIVSTIARKYKRRRGFGKVGNMEELIRRINELAKTAKERELTPEESEERARLRKEYLEIFRKGFRQQLLHTKVVDEEGNDVTPEKLKDPQEEEGQE